MVGMVQVNDASYVPEEGKSREDLWAELCSLLCSQAEHVPAHVDAEAVLRSGLARYTNEAGYETQPSVSHAEAAAVLSLARVSLACSGAAWPTSMCVWGALNAPAMSTRRRWRRSTP